MDEQSRSTAELIVECLENEGVTHVFGIPGEENIRLIEALSKSSIDYVLTRITWPGSLYLGLIALIPMSPQHRAKTIPYFALANRNQQLADAANTPEIRKAAPVPSIVRTGT